MRVEMSPCSWICSGSVHWPVRPAPPPLDPVWDVFQRLGGRRARRRSRCHSRGSGYCFQLVARATLGADTAVEGASTWPVDGHPIGVTAWDVDRAGAGACMALVAAWVADKAADCVNGWQVALEPALHPLLLVLDGVPGEKDEQEP